MNTKQRILGGLWGSLVGDALGVPVEFQTRATVQANPVTGMRGYGTHNQPPGTWSDDSSLLLCSTESLVEQEFSPEDMAGRFLRWRDEAHWTPRGRVFDIGNTTSRALSNVAAGDTPVECGGRDQFDNGNGSLMRILPVCLRFADTDTTTLTARIEDASSITHGHRRSLMACVFHGLLVRGLLRGETAESALHAARRDFQTHYIAPWNEEFLEFRNVLNPKLSTLSEREIASGGYVMDTLTASLWCLLTTDNFRDCVLQAVNLGSDTDTTGCVAGGLAGVFYGLDAIPPDWLDELARKDEVSALFQRFTELIRPL